MLPHLTICICTCGRPHMLERLLREVARQDTAGAFTFSIVVTDNDAAESARVVVEKFQREHQLPPQAEAGSVANLPIKYTVQPERNIALARNTALAHAVGDYIVCIDDDEFPVSNWLLHLLRTCENHGVAGVLGPVLPSFARTTPAWVTRGGFYDRPRHETGFIMSWSECRTGNVLFHRSILDRTEPPFRREFGTGGEDQDFFRRMIEKGHRFVWCDEAIAYEEVPPQRCRRRFMLSRALLRGKNSFRHPKGRTRGLVKSIVAVAAYTLALPFLLMAGHHRFMRYLIKLTDHAGRLLASVGLNPVSERQM